MNDFRDHENEARAEIIGILEKTNISKEDRIILHINSDNNHPTIRIEKLEYPIGRFFRRFSFWKEVRSYDDVTYERLLYQIKIHPEWLAFDMVFSYNPPVLEAVGS